MRPDPSRARPSDAHAPPRTITELQFLRLLAAVMVLVSHLQHQVKDRAFLQSAGFVPFEPVFWAGGVDIFFVISGFIMYHLSHDEFGRRGAAARFMTRRMIRIVPPYWLCTVAMLVALYLFKDQIKHSDPSWAQVFGSFFFLPLADPYGTYYPILILGWTLNFEVLFYVIFAVGLLMPWRFGLAFLALAIAVVGLVPFVTRVRTAPFAFWCNPIVFEFLFGIGLAYIRTRGMRISAAAGWSLCLLGFVTMVFVKSSGVHIIGPLRPIWMGLPALVVCAGLALIREEQSGGGGRLWRWLVIGGNASYALYLTHPFAINAVSLVFAKSGARSPWLFIGVAFLASCVVAVAAHLYVEHPLHETLRRWVGRSARPKGLRAPA